MLHEVQQHRHQHRSHDISPPPLKRRRIGDDGRWQTPRSELLSVQPVPAIREDLDTIRRFSGPVPPLYRNSSHQSSLSHGTVHSSNSAFHSHNIKERRLWHSDIGVTKTDTHARKPICNTCGRTQNVQYDPIITCTKCRRHYHDSCRNPAFGAGENGQMWKCFKCLPGGRRRPAKFPSLPGGYNPTTQTHANQNKTFATPSTIQGQQKLQAVSVSKQLNHGDNKPRPLQEIERTHQPASSVIDGSKTKRISRQSVLDNAMKAAGLFKPSIRLEKDRAHDGTSDIQHASKQRDARRSSIMVIPDTPEAQLCEPADVSVIVKWQESVEHTAPGEMDDVSLIELSQHDSILNPGQRLLKRQKHGDLMRLHRKVTDDSDRARDSVVPNTPDSLNFEEADQISTPNALSADGRPSCVVELKFSKAMIPVVRQMLKLAPKRSQVRTEEDLGAVKEMPVTSQTKPGEPSISSPLSAHKPCAPEISSFRPINQITSPTVAEPKRPIDDQTHGPYNGQISEGDKADVDILNAPETTSHIGSSPQNQNDDALANTPDRVDAIPQLRHTFRTDQGCSAEDKSSSVSPENPCASYPSPNSSRATSADVSTISSKRNPDTSNCSRAYTLREIAGMALAAANGEQCTPTQVVSWATQHFPHLRPGEAWESSLRCSLSLSPEFSSKKLINAPRRNMKSYSFTDGVWRAHYEEQYSEYMKSSLCTSLPKSGSKTNSSLEGLSSPTSKQCRGNLRDRAGFSTCSPVPAVSSSLRFEVKGSSLADQIISTHEVQSLTANKAVTPQMLVRPAHSSAKTLPIGAWTVEEKAQKIASIKARPSRKHFFGSGHRLAHKRRHGLQDIHDERDGAWKPQSVREDLLTTNKSGHANVTDDGTLRDLFDLPENVIPINDGVGELAFRDATLVNGKLPRSRHLYRVGKIVAGELTIRSS